MLQWLELVGECWPYAFAMHSELSGFQEHYQEKLRAALQTTSLAGW